MATHETASEMLDALQTGDGTAADRLMPLVYDQLRALAAHYLENEGAGHTLQPTALVHEAYLRLIEQSRTDWKGRAHFTAVAARMIRRILVDHARGKKRQKRGGRWERIAIDEASCGSAPQVDFAELDEAMEELGRLSPRQQRVVELRYFGGLSIAETAHVLDICEATVKADWAQARAWLYARMSRSADEAPGPG